MARGVASRRTALRRLCGAPATTQGDWRAMADLYAANRHTFQGAYARACWARVSARPTVRSVVASAGHVLDVGSGTGDFTAELQDALPRSRLTGVDISADMVRHAARQYPHVRFVEADLASASEPPLGACSVDLATSFMALHWPGPDRRLVRRLYELLRPGGAWVAGFHGAGSCQEGVDAIDATARSAPFRDYFFGAALGHNKGASAAAAADHVARSQGEDSLLDALPTMFRRDPAALWVDRLGEAGFVDVDVRPLEIRTAYRSTAECYQRLMAAWPPIFSPSHIPADRLPDFVGAAAQAMVDAYDPPSADGVVAVMTSHVLEISARRPDSSP